VPPAPGQIVLLFAAGTDAERYEAALRAAGPSDLPRDGRGYFGQQQVVDLLRYLRLLHNRYETRTRTRARISFVGLSNDALRAHPPPRREASAVHRHRALSP